jgi:hypothetical protein
MQTATAAGPVSTSAQIVQPWESSSVRATAHQGVIVGN